MPLITETYYLSLTQDNRGILRLRCSQDDTLRTVNLKLYNNGSIFAIPSGISASVSGVKQNGAVFSKPCTISQDRESVVLQLSSDITNVDGIIVAEIVLNDGEGGRLGTSNFIIQVEKNPIRAGVIQDTETPIEYINDFIEKIQTLTARLNNLITPSGDPSLAEVVDARIGILDSITYQTLGARLNAEFQRLSNALNGITILESTGDTTDRTSEILSKLNAYGTCKLGKGDFYVSSLVMPEGSHLIGSGKSTRVILPSSVTNGYIVKPRSNCIVENISFYGGFTGTYSELIASGANARVHCIILDRFDSVNSENVILSNIFINNFVGSAVLQRYTTGCHCKDVIINMCYAGIDISNASYDGLCVNVYINDTKFGVVQNGSNFIFSSCISKDSVQHIMSDQQNTECTFSSCTFFDSSLETTARLANLSNARSGFVFDNCIFDSSLSMILNACDGIVIKGTNFVGSDTFTITVSNGRNTLLLITDCIADVEPTVTNAGTAARITSCYLKDGTAWTISEVDITVDDELSDESENPVQNKVINRAIGEIKADLGDLDDNVNNVVSLKETVPISYIKENDGKYIKFSTGELTKSTPYRTTNYVNITGLSKITYSKIKVTAASATTIGMAFYDANKEYVDGIRARYNQAEAGYEDSTVEVPSNAVYARFSMFIDENTYGVFSVSGKSILKGAFDVQKERIDNLAEEIEPLDGVDGRVGAIENIISLAGGFDIPFTILDVGKSIKYSTGELMSNSNNSATDYINISVYGSLTYRRIKQTDSGTAGMAFYDANKEYIGGKRAITQQAEAGYMDELDEITVPHNAVYARFTTKKDTETYGEFSLTGSSKLHDLLPKESIYRKDVTFGSMSPEWYKGQGDDYSLFNINTLYSEMITRWDALLADSKGYMTKEAIGTASDNQTMYVYKLIPLRYRNNTAPSITNNPPTFFIIASQHGFEKSAAYGTYYFAKDLVYNFDKNPVLNAIRTKCAIYVVPVGNPYGFDNKTRKNANGVDLNRNWAPSDDDDPSSAYYGGAEPFDQPETQAIKSVIDGNPNLFFVVDYHTNGQYKADSWADVNWIAYPYLANINDEYFNHTYIAGQFHISDISENLPLEYGLNTNGESIGTATQGASGSPRPTIGYYCRAQKNTMGFTFEGNNGLPSEESAYSAIEQKINSELIGNWIKNLFLVFKDAS